MRLIVINQRHRQNQERPTRAWVGLMDLWWFEWSNTSSQPPHSRSNSTSPAWTNSSSQIYQFIYQSNPTHLRDIKARMMSRFFLWFLKYVFLSQPTNNHKLLNINNLKYFLIFFMEKYLKISNLVDLQHFRIVSTKIHSPHYIAIHPNMVHRHWIQHYI